METPVRMSCLLTSTIKIFSQPQVGIVEQAIAYNRRGRVKFDGTYWPARFYYSNFLEVIYPDQLITVIGMEGITLLVIPLGKGVTSETLVYFPVDEVVDTPIPWETRIYGRKSSEIWQLSAPLF